MPIANQYIFFDKVKPVPDTECSHPYNINRNEIMNINDPFGRMQDKHQRNYESLCSSLQKAGLTNRADAQALLEKLRWRVIWGLAFIVPVTLLLALVLPELRFIVLACGILLLFWLSKTSVQSREYVKRYIREELTEDDESSSP